MTSPLEIAIASHCDEVTAWEDAVKEFSDGPPTREIPAETMAELVESSRR